MSPVLPADGTRLSRGLGAPETVDGVSVAMQPQTPPSKDPSLSVNVQWMDEVLHRFETMGTMSCWGSHHSRISERWCDRMLSNPIDAHQTWRCGWGKFVPEPLGQV